MISTHPIVAEFLAFLDKIQDLYHHNGEFRLLLGSYHKLDEAIFEIEKGEIPAKNDVLTQKRKDRVFLKDEIYNILKDE